MVSAREWLSKLDPPLAKFPSRGRLSAEAHAALTKARAEGMTFDEKTVPIPSTKPKVNKPPRKTAKDTVDPKAVRKWAGANGITVGERGRIHVSIINQYIDAMTESGQEVEKPKEENLFGDTPPRLRSNDKFVATDLDNSKIVLTERDCCTVCQFSLGWCRCYTSYTWSRVDVDQRLPLTPA